MDNLIIPATDFTPTVNFQIESGHLELSGVSRPEDVAGFYEGPTGVVDKTGRIHPE